MGSCGWLLMKHRAAGLWFVALALASMNAQADPWWAGGMNGFPSSSFAQPNTGTQRDPQAAYMQARAECRHVSGDQRRDSSPGRSGSTTKIARCRSRRAVLRRRRRASLMDRAEGTSAVVSGQPPTFSLASCRSSGAGGPGICSSSASGSELRHETWLQEPSLARTMGDSPPGLTY